MNPPDTLPMTPEEQAQFKTAPTSLPDTLPMTVDDVRGLMADPSYVPAPEEARMIYDAQNKRTLGQKVDAFGNAMVEGVKGIGQEVMAAHRELADEPMTWENAGRAGKTLVEAPLEAVRGWAHLGKEAFNYLGDSAKEKVSGASEEEKFQNWYNRLLQTRADEQSAAKSIIGGAFPQASRALSNVLDPTFLVGGEFIKPLSGAAKIAAKTIPGAARALEVAGKVAGAAKALPGAALEKVGGAVSTVAGLPGTIVQGSAERLMGDAAAKQAGAVMGGAGVTSAIAGHGTPVGHVLGVLKMAEKAGAITQKTGEFLTALAKTDESQIPRLLQMANDRDLPTWLREISRAANASGLGKLAQLGTGLAEGAAHGAATGAVLGAASGRDAEGVGQMAGAGVALGAAGRVASEVSGAQAQARAARARMSDLQDFYRYLTQRGTPSDTIKRIDTTTALHTAALQSATARRIFGKRLDFTFLDGKAFADQTRTTASAFYNRITKEIVVNVDSTRDAITHEISHAVAQAKGADSQARTAIDLLMSPDEVVQAGREYASKLVDDKLKALGHDATALNPAVREQMVVNEMAQLDASNGNSNKWIYDEIYADAGWGALKGRDITRTVAPTVRERVADWLRKDSVRPVLEAMGVGQSTTPPSGALFTNPKIYGPEMRKLVLGHLRDLRERGPSAAPEPALPIPREQVGKNEALPVSPQPDGTSGNSLYRVTKDGVPVERSPAEIRREDEKRRRAAEQAVEKFDKTTAPAEIGDPDKVVKLRRTISGMLLRTGEELPKWFYDLPQWSDASKEKARALEQSIQDGKVVALSYFQAGAGRGKDYTDSLTKARGSFSFTLRDVLPFGFLISKAGETDVAGRRLKTGGNISLQLVDLTTANTKIHQWAEQNKLPEWGGDAGKVLADLKTYFANHAEGRPGETGIGVEKRDALNALIIGDNVTHRARNLRRAALEAADRAGLIRSFRLDRIEMVKPTGENLGRAEYNKKVLNLSPDVQFSPDAGEERQPTPRELKRQYIEQGTEAPAFKKWFGASKVVDEQGQPVRVFRGDYRADAIKGKFEKGKATSARFYFTEDPEIASNYAKGKPYVGDTSYENWFSFPQLKGRGERRAPNLDQAWHRLTPEQRAKVQQVVENTSRDDDGKLVFDAGHSIMSEGGVEHEAQQARGNWLKAAKSIWLESGALFNDEHEFLNILKAAGLDASYDDPHAQRSAVTPVYLSIQNPLDTSNIPADTLATLEKVARMDRSRAARNSFPGWDKETYTARDWVAGLLKDLQEHADDPGKSAAWTAMPEKITKTLQRLGYDGIKDTGGKMGGPDVGKHRVWIAFEPNQIKSVFNRGTFDPNTDKISFSPDTPEPPKPEQEPVVDPFYSKLVKVLESDKVQAKGQPAQFKAILRNPQHAIKADELKWTGLDDFLDAAARDRRAVTKQELLDWVKTHQVEIKEQAPSGGTSGTGAELDFPSETNPDYYPVSDDDIQSEYDNYFLEDEKDKSRDEFKNDNWRDFTEVEHLDPDELKDMRVEPSRPVGDRRGDRWAVFATLPDGERVQVSKDNPVESYALREADRIGVEGWDKPGKFDEDKFEEALEEYVKDHAWDRARDAAERDAEHYWRDAVHGYEIRWRDDGGGYRLATPNGDEIFRPGSRYGNFKSWDDAVEAAQNHASETYGESINESGEKTKWLDYTLAGEKSNYREMLFTLHLPEAPFWNEALLNKISRDLWGGRDFDQLPLAGSPLNERRQVLDYYNKENPEPEKAKPFVYGPHWDDDENVLMHARVDDRKDVQNRKTLFLEELQSDWHLQGNKNGYKGPEVEQRRAALKAEMQSLQEQEAKFDVERDELVKQFVKHYPEEILTALKVRENYGDDGAERFLSGIAYNQATAAAQLIHADAPLGKKGTGMFPGKTDDSVVGEVFRWLNQTHYIDEQIYAAREQYRNAEREYGRAGSAVPDAPLKTNWFEFVMKRMLRLAAEGDYKQIAWTTGEQQRERYSLAKQLDTLRWVPDEKDATRGELVGYQHGAERVTKKIAREQLPEYVGKEISEKLLEQLRPDARALGGDVERHLLDGAEKWVVTLDGTALKESAAVPHGDDLPKFYDSKAEAEAALQSLVPTRNMAELSGVDLKIGGEGKKRLYDKMLVEWANKYLKKWNARVGSTEIDFGGEQPEKVLTIPITPAMKHSVLHEGQPMFAPDVPTAPAKAVPKASAAARARIETRRAPVGAAIVRPPEKDERR